MLAFSMLRPQVGLLTKQPQLATKIVFSQLPRASVALGVRAYSSSGNQGKQILLRDHGVFGKFDSCLPLLDENSTLTSRYDTL